MRERAHLLGGRIDAGPRAGGGLRVVARLPVVAGRVSARWPTGGALLAPPITRRLIGQFKQRRTVDGAVARRLDHVTDWGA